MLPDIDEKELHYLRWFHANADFGPADSDVRYNLNQYYIEEFGDLPEGYGEE